MSGFSIMNKVVEQGASAVLSIPGTSTFAYTTLKASINKADSTGMGVALLEFASICFNSVLTDESKASIDKFLSEDDVYKKVYEKYNILKKVMSSETKKLEPFLSENSDLAKKYLTLIGIDYDPTINVEKLKADINANVPKIINLLNENKVEIEKMIDLVESPVKSGGKRTKRRKSKKLSKRYKRK